MAEWSIRSTIAYLICVAVTHFLPGIEPSPYHPKRTDISEDGMLMLELAEYQYNKMINNTDKPIKLIPVLPNLISSTDEVTIFATPTTMYCPRKRILLPCSKAYFNKK